MASSGVLWPYIAGHTAGGVVDKDVCLDEFNQKLIATQTLGDDHRPGGEGDQGAPGGCGCPGDDEENGLLCSRGVNASCIEGGWPPHCSPVG